MTPRKPTNNTAHGPVLSAAVDHSRSHGELSLAGDVPINDEFDGSRPIPPRMLRRQLGTTTRLCLRPALRRLAATLEPGESPAVLAPGWRSFRFTDLQSTRCVTGFAVFLPLWLGLYFATGMSLLAAWAIAFAATWAVNRILGMLRRGECRLEDVDAGLLAATDRRLLLLGRGGEIVEEVPYADVGKVATEKGWWLGPATLAVTTPDRQLAFRVFTDFPKRTARSALAVLGDQLRRGSAALAAPAPERGAGELAAAHTGRV
jgi:hypothetical protein